MADASFRDFVIDQLRGLGEVEAKAMFGGHGLYAGGVFFGILWKGKLFFKTDDGNRRDYTSRRMKAFRPRPGKGAMKYYEVPVEVLEDSIELASWAAKAVAAGAVSSRRR